MRAARQQRYDVVQRGSQTFFLFSIDGWSVGLRDDGRVRCSRAPQDSAPVGGFGCYPPDTAYPFQVEDPLGGADRFARLRRRNFAFLLG
jgi:hypothetical protein